MRFTRRDFLTTVGLGSLSLYLAGCAENQQLTTGLGRPSSYNGRLTTAPPMYPNQVNPRDPGRYLPPTPPTPPRLPPNTPTIDPSGAVAITGPVKAIPRSVWASAPPIASRVQPLGSVDRITVHHEGWTPVWFADKDSTAKRLDSIRGSHLDRLHAGDIGYHFVIDRAGRIWQGRDLVYQGAHVHDNNARNVGVMCLGNFDLQKPTDEQLATLRQTLVTLKSYYRVTLPNIYTHQELNPTECPGKDLQARMITLRRNGLASV